jgi:2-iminobutanoate/2-iminopropanoate deaminase
MRGIPIQPADLKPPVGAYTPAIRAGDLIFVSGQVPVDPKTGTLIGNTVAEQTNAVLDRVAHVLAAAGASLSDVVSVTAYLSSIDDWDEFNDAYRARMTPPFPTRTTVGAQLHGFMVEISVTAYAPAES